MSANAISGRTTRRGAILVLLALMLPITLILAAFAINLAYMELNRTELQIATDAAARAGGRDLLVLNSQGLAMARAKALAKQNPVGGKPLTLKNSDCVFGVATRTSIAQRYTFTPGGTAFNALQVTGHRDAASADGSLKLLFPGFLNISKVNTSQMAQSTEGDIDIALVVDRSGSMAWATNETTTPPLGPPAAAPPGWAFGQPVPNPSRWVDLVAGVQVFVNELQNSACREYLALCSYNDSTSIDSLLSSSYAGVVPALNAYSAAYQMGTTATGDGIICGVNALAGGSARPWAAKVLLVMTDGLTNCGTDPLAAAQMAADQNIMIFTVTFSDEADQSTMAQVASIGAGKHYHANNGNDLKQVFIDISKQLPTLLMR